MKISSELIAYIAMYKNQGDGENGTVNLPSLKEISGELGISVSRLREQLEVAKALGFVDVKPRTGIRKLPYTFLPATRSSLSYALSQNWKIFFKYADLRNHIETAYWYEAVEKLTDEDKSKLSEIIDLAWSKLGEMPIHVPHKEHREMHLLIYSRLNNVFVDGLLKTYWDAYESVGLNMYSDLDYLQQVWDYHQKIVEAINKGEYKQGYDALILHRDLLYHRSGQTVGRENIQQEELI